MSRKSRRWLWARTRCADCGIDVAAAGQRYMLRDEVWAATGLGPGDGVLCLRDVEQRLGRPLQCEDFKPTDHNNRDYWHGAHRMLPQVWKLWAISSWSRDPGRGIRRG
jgi:hypothetical protein